MKQEYPLSTLWPGRLNALSIPAVPARYGPISWNQYLGRRLFSFILEWNEYAGMFILAIRDGESELVRTALQYGWDALERFQHIPQLRGVSLVPFDPSLSGMESGVTFGNLGRTIFVFYKAE